MAYFDFSAFTPVLSDVLVKHQSSVVQHVTHSVNRMAERGEFFSCAGADSLLKSVTRSVKRCPSFLVFFF